MGGPRRGQEAGECGVEQASALTAEQKALNNTISQIEKTFGAGAIMRLGEGSSHGGRGRGHRRPSRSTWRSAARGCPRGGSSRSSARSRAARRPSPSTPSPTPSATGGVAAFIDAEHALDPSWCKKLGVNIEELLVSQPGSAEEALQIAEELVMCNALDIIVIDSVAALVPRRRAGGGDRRQLRRRPGPADEPGAAEADGEGERSRSACWSSSTRSARRSA